MMKACRSCGNPFHAKWRNAGEVCADCGGNPESDSVAEAHVDVVRMKLGMVNDPQQIREALEWFAGVENVNHGTQIPAKVRPFPATASVIPCETREEAEATSETMTAHGADVLIARRPRWYVRALPEDVRTADWCIVVLEANRAS